VPWLAIVSVSIVVGISSVLPVSVWFWMSPHWYATASSALLATPVLLLVPSLVSILTVSGPFYRHQAREALAYRQRIVACVANGCQTQEQIQRALAKVSIRSPAQSPLAKQLEILVKEKRLTMAHEHPPTYETGA